MATLRLTGMVGTGKFVLSKNVRRITKSVDSAFLCPFPAAAWMAVPAHHLSPIFIFIIRIRRSESSIHFPPSPISLPKTPSLPKMRMTSTFNSSSGRRADLPILSRLENMGSRRPLVCLAERKYRPRNGRIGWPVLWMNMTRVRVLRHPLNLVQAESQTQRLRRNTPRPRRSSKTTRIQSSMSHYDLKVRISHR